MTEASILERLALPAVRLLLRAFPRRAREADGEDMVRTLRESLREARQRGPLHQSAELLAECVDMTRAALAERRGARIYASSRKSPGGFHVVPTWFEWRHAVRKLVAQPSYSLIVIAALTLGIGANTVVFSVADAALFRGVPYRNGPRLVEIFNYSPVDKFSYPGLLPAVLQEWRRHTDVFERIEGWGYTSLVFSGGTEPESMAGAQVTPGMFEMLGAPPALGRSFEAGEGVPGRDRVVILSDGLWRRRFGGDPGAIGRQITLNDQRYTVIGVMPRGFRFPAEPQQVWLPIPADGTGAPRRVEALALLTRGLTMALAQPRLEAIAADLDKAQPIAAGWSVLLMPPRAARLDDTTKRALQILLGAVFLVLLIACANVANLSFTQAIARQRELAIRAALGATRWRLVRGLLAESLVLACAGGALGLLAAWLGVDAAAALAPESLTKWSASVIGIDRRVLLFTATMTIGTGLIFGILPAIRASRTRSGDALKGRSASGSGSHSRLRSLLVVAEVALSVVLLIGAGLLIRSFVKLQRVDVGFDPSNLLTISIALPSDRYPATERQRFFSDLAATVAKMPGVHAVTMANGVPPSGGSIHFGDQFEAEGGAPPVKKLVILPDNAVAPEFFAAMRIPLLAGRTFTSEDTREAAVISQGMASRYWPGQSPLGKRFRLTGRADWYTIVGVAAEVRALGISDNRSDVEMYSPLWPRRVAPPSATSPAGPGRGTAAPAPSRPATRTFIPAMLLVRADRPMHLVTSIKAAVWAIDKDQPVERVALAEDLLAASLKEQRFALVLMTSFAVLALLLAAAGLYAVLSNLVVQRRQEIGIRVALGARSADVLNLIVSRGLAMTLIGVGIGLAGAFALARYIRTQLYEVSARDPLSFTAVTVLLTVIALVACWIPTRRALSIDPASALRTE